MFVFRVLGTAWRRKGLDLSTRSIRTVWRGKQRREQDDLFPAHYHATLHATKGCTQQFAKMAGEEDDTPTEMYTTNEQDRQEADKLKNRLRSNQQANNGLVTGKVDAVQIANGAHKYVLIQAENNGKTEYFVTSRKGAHYHRNAAEPLIFELEGAGYYDIEVTGGGRIHLDEVNRTISIFGFSYSFGLANHAISREVVLEDPRYKDFEVTISNEGY